MKKIVLILLIVTVVSNAQWMQVNIGMGNKNVSSLVVSGNSIFAGTLSFKTSYGVYLSTNNGVSWTQTSLNNRNVYSLAVNGNNIFVGTVGAGVFLSTNNGTSWSQTSLNNQTVISLAVNGNNIFAGTGSPANGVYLSTNNGTSWTQTSLNNLTVWSLAINGNNVFAGIYAPAMGVYLSTNNGTSWTQTSLNNRSVWSLMVSGNNIFVGTDQNYGIYQSTDNGINWTQTSLNNRNVYSLAVNGNNIYAGTDYYGVYVSNNNGTNWAQRNEGLGNLFVDAFCIVNNYIFAGTGNSVYRRPLSELTGITPISTETPNQFSLSQNYPNPFNPTTNVQFSIINVQFVILKIFDVTGREVETLVNEELKPGTYEVSWNADKFASGVYYYKFQIPDCRLDIVRRRRWC